MADDWIADLVRKHKERYGSRMAEQARVKEQAKNVAALEGKFWEQLGKSLDYDAARFNELYGKEILTVENKTPGMIEVIMQPSKARTRVTLHRDRHVVEWPDRKATYLFEGDKILPEGQGQAITAEDLSKQIISSVTQ